MSITVQGLLPGIWLVSKVDSCPGHSRKWNIGYMSIIYADNIQCTYNRNYIWKVLTNYAIFYIYGIGRKLTGNINV